VKAIEEQQCQKKEPKGEEQDNRHVTLTDTRQQHNSSTVCESNTGTPTREENTNRRRTRRQTCHNTHVHSNNSRTLCESNTATPRREENTHRRRTTGRYVTTDTRQQRQQQYSMWKPYRNTKARRKYQQAKNRRTHMCTKIGNSTNALSAVDEQVEFLAKKQIRRNTSAGKTACSKRKNNLQKACT